MNDQLSCPAHRHSARHASFGSAVQAGACCTALLYCTAQYLQHRVHIVPYRTHRAARTYSTVYTPTESCAVHYSTYSMCQAVRALPYRTDRADGTIERAAVQTSKWPGLRRYSPMLTVGTAECYMYQAPKPLSSRSSGRNHGMDEAK